VGELNCRFARQELARLRIPILLEDVGGDGGMKIALQTHTFSVDARRMREQAAPDVTLARSTRVIAVVGNMGSQLSLVAFLERLGRDAPPVVVSGAIPGTRLLKGRPEWGMSWRIAENHELLENGKVYFAPEGSATEVGSSGSDGAFQVAIHHHRKLENRELNGCLIQSLSRGLASSAAVVLLGGKMDSGAEAFVEFSKQGAFTVVESPESAAFSELPSFVVNLGAATRVLPAGKIAEAFGVLTRRRAA
jgi:two-component system chemotaxis response regulator CheB